MCVAPEKSGECYNCSQGDHDECEEYIPSGCFGLEKCGCWVCDFAARVKNNEVQYDI